MLRCVAAVYGGGGRGGGAVARRSGYFLFKLAAGRGLRFRANRGGGRRGGETRLLFKLAAEKIDIGIAQVFGDLADAQAAL